MFENFIESLPPKVRCTDDFSQGTKFRKKEKALGFKYIEVSQFLKKQIIIDIDRPGAAFDWEELNLPRPSWITINPKNTHCHYCYELNTPVVYTEQGRRKPQAYFEAIESALTNTLDGDPCYIGRITKNPLHPSWKTIQHHTSYDLQDFQEYLSISPSKDRSSLVYDVHGRNSTLFNTVRLWAYRQVREHTNREAFYRAVEHETIAVNAQFINWQGGMLPQKEIRSTAHSIAKWTWVNRHSIGNIINRGVMNLSDDMPLSEKQIAAAAYSANIKTNKTNLLLLDSARKLKANGIHITQKAVAESSKMSLKTIKRHWDLISNELKLYE